MIASLLLRQVHCSIINPTGSGLGGKRGHAPLSGRKEGGGKVSPDRKIRVVVRVKYFNEYESDGRVIRAKFIWPPPGYIHPRAWPTPPTPSLRPDNVSRLLAIGRGGYSFFLKRACITPCHANDWYTRNPYDPSSRGRGRGEREANGILCRFNRVETVSVDMHGYVGFSNLGQLLFAQLWKLTVLLFSFQRGHFREDRF